MSGEYLPPCWGPKGAQSSFRHGAASMNDVSENLLRIAAPRRSQPVASPCTWRRTKAPMVASDPANSADATHKL